jgi:hypothetical protein
VNARPAKLARGGLSAFPERSGTCGPGHSAAPQPVRQESVDLRAVFQGDRRMVLAAMACRWRRGGVAASHRLLKQTPQRDKKENSLEYI